ncbi:MAG: leucine-rich repeat protein [Bacilli bacterium]|nr:leucine-rich repeat protein [Bacilli bacterium]
MKKTYFLPLVVLSAFTFASCGNNNPEPVQLTLVSEWGSFNDEYPTPKMTLNAMKSQKLSEVKGLIEPKPFFPDVHTFSGWAFDAQGTKRVDKDYVIDGNVTLYANYERKKEVKESYILYNYNSNSSVEETVDRNVVKFEYEGELTEGDVEATPIKESKPNIVYSNNNTVTITYQDELPTYGPSLITIKKPIDNLRLSDGIGSLSYPLGNQFITAVLLNDGATKVDDYAFYGCAWLMAISLPDTIKTIGTDAFTLCYSLNSFEVPKALKEIPYEAFYGCATMEHVYFNEGLEKIGSRSFFGCASLKEIHIPDSVTTLGAEAFNFCLTNNDLRIGRGINVIPDRCFASNYYLQKVTIPNTISELGSACFQYCDSLTEVVFEDGGDIKIEETDKINAPFQYCISLSKIKFPSRFKTMGNSTFQHTMLYELDLTSSDTIVSFGMNSLGQDTPLNYNYGKIIVPNNLVDAYKGAEGWKDHASIIVGQ